MHPYTPAERESVVDVRFIASDSDADVGANNGGGDFGLTVEVPLTTGTKLLQRPLDEPLVGAGCKLRELDPPA